MKTELYVEQQVRWPQQGRVLLGHFDDQQIVVYQAFRPQIAEEVLHLGRMGPSFLRTRMSWIKTNFLWMMFRSGWASKLDQERVLALWITRAFFEQVIAASVPSIFDPASALTRHAWSVAVKRADVLSQWDPDRGPSGAPLQRKAVQLGLRGAMLREYADYAIMRVEDVTPIVHAARPNARSPFLGLQTPRERVYVLGNPVAVAALGM
jgi:hypothetical protein